jgi:hypothetical protein
MKTDTKDALREQFKASVPLGRMGLAEEVASAALLSFKRKQLHHRLTCLLTVA